jgi:hypothetical protein
MSSFAASNGCLRISSDHPLHTSASPMPFQLKREMIGAVQLTFELSEGKPGWDILHDGKTVL